MRHTYQMDYRSKGRGCIDLVLVQLVRVVERTQPRPVPAVAELVAHRRSELGQQKTGCTQRCHALAIPHGPLTVA